MQPNERDRKAKSNSANQARARLLVKQNLWWLHGYPLINEAGACAWRTIPEPGQGPAEKFDVTREHLNRAQFTVNKLHGGFPRAFPRIVEDATHWVEAVHCVLGHLKEGIHGQTPLPTSLLHEEALFAKRLRHRVGKLPKLLYPLVNAASWAYVMAPEVFQQVLAWLEQEQVLVDVCLSLDRQNHGRLLFLARLSVDFGPDSVRPLLVGMDRYSRLDHPFSGELVQRLQSMFVKGSRQTPMTPDLFEEPGKRMGPAFLEWIDCLSQIPRNRLGSVLKLYELSAPLELTDAWASWWAELRSGFRMLRKTYAASPKIPGNARQVAKALSWIALRIEQRPRALRIAHYLAFLEAAGEDKNLVADQIRVLAAIPDANLRLVLVGQWHHEAVEPWRVRGFADYLERLQHRIEHALRPWTFFLKGKKHLCKHYYGGEPDEPIHIRELPRNFYRTLGDIVEALNRSCPVRLPEVLMVMLDAGVPVEKVSERLSAWAASQLNEFYYEKSTLVIANLACADSNDRFLEILIEVEDRSEFDAWNIVAALEDLQAVGLGEIHAWLNIGTFLRRLDYVGEVLKQIKASHKPTRLLADAPENLPDWVDHYPDQLNEALRFLSANHPKAQKEAARILGSAFPDPTRLAREIAALEQRLPTEPSEKQTLLNARISKLKKRTENQVQYGQRKLDNLVAKLYAFGYRFLLDRWEAAISDGREYRLYAMLAKDRLPDWCEEPGIRTLLGHLLKLGKTYQHLALDLLERRSGPKPWDLRHEPMNQQFVEKLASKGLEMAPWLDCVGVRSYQTKQGPITLELGEDPFEVMRMGSYFKTCLCPDSFNFFSAVTNAADINKRVLWARDPEASIVGRCLLALTKEGWLVTFRPYCFNSGIGFEDLVRDFTEELCRQMKTLIVPEGSIPTLVAPEWYDDGAHDLSRRFRFLKEGSSFRMALRAMAPKQFEKQMIERFAPLGLNSFTLPLVFNLEEFWANRDLVLYWMKDLEGYINQLSSYALVPIARVASENGNPRAAIRFLDQHLKIMGLQNEALELLIAIDPVKLMRLLRKSDVPDRWANTPAFSYWRGRGLEALHRPKQALRIYEGEPLDDFPYLDCVVRSLRLRRLLGLEVVE